MRVCVDVQPAMGQRAGVGRYARALVEHLGALRGNDLVRLFYFDFRRRGLPFPAGDMEHKAVRWCPGRVMQKSWNVIKLPLFDRVAGPADVYHFPNFVIPPLTQGRKSIATIHDMSFLAYPEFAEKRNLAWLTSRISDTVKRADAVITDSEFSANEILDRLPLSRDKLFPIHLGLSEYFKPPADGDIRHMRRTFGLNRPYILMVGTIEPRKNIDFLVGVFERMTEFKGDLVLTGMRGWKYQPILARINGSPRSRDIRYLEYVSDEALPALYGGADAFVFPSLYEGFGFPPLEAMACGTPVVASDAASLPEVLGDAALLVSGFDADAWASEIMQTLSGNSVRRAMIDGGRDRASRFTWDETARKTWEVYRQVAL